jgi:cold shock CspA family protein
MTIELKEGELKGTVKWFTHSGNYGFITTEDNIDYYFNGDDLKGFVLDKRDEVYFMAVNSKTKFKAKNVRLVQKAVNENSLITCAQCRREMIPELNTKEVQNPKFKFIKHIEKSYVCPHCDYVIGKYDEDKNSNTIMYCTIISVICIYLLYKLMTMSI